MAREYKAKTQVLDNLLKAHTTLQTFIHQAHCLMAYLNTYDFFFMTRF